jgi:hypothetical protein
MKKFKIFFASQLFRPDFGLERPKNLLDQSRPPPNPALAATETDRTALSHLKDYLR